jgi:hypothetical protein
MITEDIYDDCISRAKMMALMELSMKQISSGQNFTAEDINSIVHLTVDVNPNLIMGYAIMIHQAGLSVRYETEPDLRQLIDAWWTSEQYAGLSIKEFLDAVGTDISV